MPLYVQAGLWGLLSGSALVLGAAIAYLAAPPQRVVAAVMAAGAGVLISAVAFDLMDEAFHGGGILPTAAGFLVGGAAYTLGNVVLSRRGARHRKRSGHADGAQQPSGNGGMAIALGALLDGVPEFVVIGVGLLDGTGVGVAMIAAVFLSNLPEGLSSAAGMRRAGRSPRYVFGVWGAIALSAGLAALAGNLLLRDAGPGVIAATTAVAAGAILAMLADTMIPEAFETAHDYAGMITVGGFLAAFALSKLGGG